MAMLVYQRVTPGIIPLGSDFFSSPSDAICQGFCDIYATCLCFFPRFGIFCSLKLVGKRVRLKNRASACQHVPGRSRMHQTPSTFSTGTWKSGVNGFSLSRYSMIQAMNLSMFHFTSFYCIGKWVSRTTVATVLAQNKLWLQMVAMVKKKHKNKNKNYGSVYWISVTPIFGPVSWEKPGDPGHLARGLRRLRLFWWLPE